MIPPTAVPLSLFELIVFTVLAGFAIVWALWILLFWAEHVRDLKAMASSWLPRRKKQAPPAAPGLTRERQHLSAVVQIGSRRLH